MDEEIHELNTVTTILTLSEFWYQVKPTVKHEMDCGMDSFHGLTGSESMH